jgi:O-methyltransferase involved in polyketide biosynthesis
MNFDGVKFFEVDRPEVVKAKSERVDTLSLNKDHV